MMLFWLFYELRLNQMALQFDRIMEERLSERLAERTRIAQELHDTLLQGFLGIAMRLQVVANNLPAKPEPAKELLDNVLDQVDQVIEEGRHAVTNLRTNKREDNDLAEALSRLGNGFVKLLLHNFRLS